VDLREKLHQHRKDNRLIFGGLAAVFVVFALIYFFLKRGQGLPIQLATNNILLFVLWYINIVLILAILFILVRSFFKLLLERKNRILGSKFKTKLVFTAIALSLIPVLILFPFATQLIVSSFDTWFKLPIDDVLSQTDEIVVYLADEIENNSQRAACLALDRLIGFELSDLGQQPALQNEMRRLRAELDTDYLAVFDGLEQIHGTANLERGFSRVPDLRGQTRLLEEALARGRGVQRVDSPDGQGGPLVLAACAGARPQALVSGEEPAGEPLRPSQTVVVTGRLIPRNLAANSDSLRLAYQQYKQFAVSREQIQNAYLQNLLMVTLLVILAFSSIGLRLARRITQPIQALVDGTRRIRAGDLDHQVEVEVDDELGVLVGAFNSMTGQLKSNKELVESANRELSAAHRRLATVLQNVAAGVIAIDASGEILTCNGAALAILSQHENEVVGRPMREAWADPERGKIVALLDEDLSAGGQIRRQIQLVAGGVWKTLEVKVTWLPDPEARPGGRVVVLEDLTELIHAQKMATWNEVARRIAHEIKNPLTPIQLTAERLLRRFEAGDPKLGETLEQGVATIVREVGSLKTMVDEFSRFARMPRPAPRDVEVDKLFAELVSLHRDIKKGVALRAEVGEGAAVASFDPEQLKALLINLIDNAIEATDAPGEIVLRSSRRGQTIVLEVADTGRGISVADKEKIFLPYFSTKGRGSGLGLSIVHRIVADHHANIEVGDNLPRGSIFSIEIPVR
jgi:two-component system nitrogen regulation sensor histidine kinase NtrY